MAADDADARRTLDRMGDKGLNTIGTLGNAVRHIASCVDKLKIDAQEARSERDAIRKSLAELQVTLRDVAGDLRRLRERQDEHNAADDREFKRLWDRLESQAKHVEALMAAERYAGQQPRQERSQSYPDASMFFSLVRMALKVFIGLVGVIFVIAGLGNQRVSELAAEIIMRFVGMAPPS